MLAKLITVGVIAALIFVCEFRIMYHVSAPFEFEPVAKTTLSCPEDGYIEKVYVVPGARVRQGQPLLKLRTVELEKRLHEAQAEAERAAASAAQAQEQALTDPTKMGDYQVHVAEEHAAEAQASLYQTQIDDSTIRAPSNGMILTGYLVDQINDFKKQGDPLFTFQGTDKLQAVLSVAENDIQQVVQYGGQHGGELATTSLPSDTYPFTIQRIEPEGQPKQGANFFKVYVNIPESVHHPEWRPGMQGQAKIDIAPRRLVWIWTHKFVDWLTLKLWTWF
jgi:multidrug efflux pump subunit AcrA (membrane-fusion protein)